MTVPLTQPINTIVFLWDKSVRTLFMVRPPEVPALRLPALRERFIRSSIGTERPPSGSRDSHAQQRRGKGPFINDVREVSIFWLSPLPIGCILDHAWELQTSFDGPKLKTNYGSTLPACPNCDTGLARPNVYLFGDGDRFVDRPDVSGKGRFTSDVHIS